MAVKIRWRQQGRKNRQTFRLVVTDIRRPRDGKYLELIGSYDPHRTQNPLQVNAERLQYWLSKGAELTHSAEKLVRELAPTVVQGMKEQKNRSRTKQAAQRRRLKKKRASMSAPAQEAPKKRKVAAPKAKKDES
jgi:small subunit ribosomal protein S16